MAKTNYTVGDFLIKVKNAALARQKFVMAENIKSIALVANVLLKLGFVSKIENEDGFLKLILAYKNKAPVLTNIKLISKPGLRVYWDLKKISSYRSPSVLVISTSKGILSSKDALKEGVGGEVIAEVL